MGKPGSKKRAVKKVEEPEPSSHTQPTVEQIKPHEINWNIVGLFSALFPLLGTGLLFILGWAYEVNWYGYFGISVNQINVSPQTVFIQSMPAAVTLFSAFVISTITYYYLTFLVKQIFRGIQGIIKPVVVNDKQGGLVNESVRYRLKDWLVVCLLTELLLLLILSPYPNLFKLSSQNTTYEVFFVQFLLLISPLALGAILVFLTLIFVISFIPVGIMLLIQRKFRSVILNRHIIYPHPQNTIWAFLIIMIIITTILALSNAYGGSDAAAGYKGSGRQEIQKVLIVSREKLFFGKNQFLQGCTDSNCIYGPFGLVAENDHEYFLIEWKKDKNERFLRQPGLFIIPRSESSYLIPGTP